MITQIKAWVGWHTENFSDYPLVHEGYAARIRDF